MSPATSPCGRVVAGRLHEPPQPARRSPDQHRRSTRQPAHPTPHHRDQRHQRPRPRRSTKTPGPARGPPRARQPPPPAQLLTTTLHLAFSTNRQAQSHPPPGGPPCDRGSTNNSRTRIRHRQQRSERIFTSKVEQVPLGEQGAASPDRRRWRSAVTASPDFDLVPCQVPETRHDRAVGSVCRSPGTGWWWASSCCGSPHQLRDGLRIVHPLCCSSWAAIESRRSSRACRGDELDSDWEPVAALMQRERDRRLTGAVEWKREVAGIDGCRGANLGRPKGCRGGQQQLVAAVVEPCFDVSSEQLQRLAPGEESRRRSSPCRSRPSPRSTAPRLSPRSRTPVRRGQ